MTIEEREEHRLDQERMKLVVPAMIRIDFREFIQRMKRANELGAFFSPTAFIEKGNALEIDIRAAEAIQECAVKLRAIYGIPLELAKTLPERVGSGA